MADFNNYFDKLKKQEAARASSVIEIPSITPDRAMQNRKVADALKAPLPAVEAAPDVFDAQLRQKENADFLLDADKIRAWIAKPENAAVAGDDVKALTSLERLGMAFGQGEARGVVRSQRFFDDLGATVEEGPLGQLLDFAGKKFDENVLSGDDGAPNILGRIANSLRGSSARNDGVPRSMVGSDRVTLRERSDAMEKSGLNSFGLAAKKVVDDYQAQGFEPTGYKEVDSFKSAFQFVTENIAASGSDMALSMITGGFAPIFNLGLLGGEVNNELAEKTNLSRDQRIAVASGTGLAMSALEMFGMSKIFGGMLPARIATDAVDGVLAEKLVKNGFAVGASKILQAGIAEGSTELLQEGLVVGVTALSGGQYKDGEIADRLVTAFITGGAVGSGLRSSSVVPSVGGKAFMRVLSSAGKTGQTKAELENIDATAATSKLKERAPDKFLEALENAGLTDKDLFIPADSVREFFQSQNLDDAEIARWGVSPEVFAEKLASGGDVVIPISDYAAKISGTDDALWLHENAVLDPDEMSPAQAQTFNEEAAQVYQEAYEEINEQRQQDEERRSDDAIVFDGMVSELRAAGRSLDVAQNEARVWSGFWRSMAERYGDSAVDLSRRFGVRVQGPNRDVVPGRKRGELDIMLNTLRRGKAKPTGQSLVNFLMRMGGLQDFGGDLSALDAPKGLISATRADFENRQIGLDGVTEALAGVSIDDAARAAVEAGYFPELLGQIADNNAGQEGDLIPAIMDAISNELAGSPLFLEGEGEGVDADLEALADQLDQLGIDVGALDNTAIIAALEAGEVGEENSNPLFQDAAPVESDAFKEWFGDSKVVDADGEPLVVYHGTRTKFDAFQNGIDVEGGSEGIFFTSDHDVAANYANSAENALEADQGVHEVYLKLENPFVYDAQGSYWTELGKPQVWNIKDADGEIVLSFEFEKDAEVFFDDYNDDFVEEYGIEPREYGEISLVSERDHDAEGISTDDMFADAIADGHDGVIVRNVLDVGGEAAENLTDPADVFIVKEPTQIKSVNNRGTFDANDPRILYQGGGDLSRDEVDAFSDDVAKRHNLRSLMLNKSGDDLNIGMIAVPRSDLGNGSGTAAMNDIVEFADANRMRITLTVGQKDDGFGTTSASRLRKFYKRFGFVENKGRNKDFSTSASMFRNPALNQEKRGSIQFPRGGLEDGQTVINLFEGADLSTFLHESGHFFLEAFTAMADHDGATPQMADDLAAIREYLGAEAGQPFEVEHHEKWARSFEAYALEGKAPSLALADAFSRFKSWLMRIYRSARDLNVKVPPSIAEVMDRMLATDSEIAEMRESVGMQPLFRDGAPAGMSDTDFSTYQRMARRSVEQAEQRLLKSTMAKVKRERESWYKSEKSAMRAEVETEINARPEHRLVEMLANKQWIGSDADVVDMQIDRAQLVDLFGEGVLPELSRQQLGGKRAIYGKDGASPQEVASFFGFPSATAMVEQLQNTPKRLDAIDLETDRRMVERYGDPLADGSIEEDALLAIHADQQAATLVAEARHMGKQSGRPVGNIKAKIYKARARAMIDAMPVRDVMRPDVFLNAERKAGRDAEKAFAQVSRGSSKAGEALNRAIDAKERQVLNHFLYREAREAEAWIRKGRDKARGYDSRKVREKVGAGFIEQIDAILERFDFRVRSNKAVERSENLREFVRRMTEEGREGELSISDKLLDEANRMHFTRLPVSELRGVFDTLTNLDHMGRFKRKLIDQKNKRDLDETVESVVTAMQANNRLKSPARTGSKSESRAKDARDYLNLTKNTDTMLREVDGFEDIGSAYKAIKQPIDEGMNRLTERRLKIANDIDAIYKRHDAKTQREMSKKRSVPALGGEYTKWELIAIALNVGNADNYQRLTNPNTKGGFSTDQVDGALQSLTEADWRTVQDIWDYLESFWPDIAAKEKRATGVAPKKVDTNLMVEAPDFVKGGYYPIKYDSRLSGRASDQTQQELTDALMGGRFGKAQTSNGHTKERALNVTMPLQLDMSVLHSHLSNVAYDVELGEAVSNSWRVLQDNRTKDAFIEHGKKSDHEALETWLQDTAAGDRVSARGLEVGLRHLRSGFTISRLALNISTVLIQPSGIAQSAVVVGKRAVAVGTLEYLRHPMRWSKDVLSVSSFMRERQKTFERDIFNVVGDMEDGPVTGRWDKFHRDYIIPASFVMMQKVQFYSVDMPTWVSAYNKELSKSGDESKAQLYADRMVARAQGSGLMSDRGAIERGTMDKNSRQRELPRMFTALGSYMFAKGNVAYEATMKTNFKSPVEAINWAIDIALLFTFEALAYSAVKGFGPEEDEELASWMAKETIFSMMSTVPLLREISGGLQGFGSGGILGSSIDKAFIKPFVQASQGEVDKALVKSLVDMGGVWLHLPSSQTNTIINAVFDNDMDVNRNIDPLAVVGVGTGRGSTLADYFNRKD